MDHFTFRLHKRGNAPEEYEDAAAADLPAGRFAVADGATESSFAREWAKILADGIGLSPGPAPPFVPQRQAPIPVSQTPAEPLRARRWGAAKRYFPFLTAYLPRTIVST